jgi:O-antigen/teichoic acid export membrane protein
MSNVENNKRIAKNTMFLFFRMFFTMGVSLYTTRIVLNALGVEDFGIYNVVGGVVSMLAFLSASMATATQRFFSFELGKKNHLQLNKIFCMSVNIHAILALFVLLIAESIGLWFLNNKLMIPFDRIEAANWVYQFSVASFIVTIMSVPYNATIISNERMKIYAYISIIDVVIKLTIVFSLLWIGYDKLKMYAVLTFFVSVLVFIIYKIYCKRNFTTSNFKLYWDKKLFITLLNYSGWNLFGSAAGVTMGQGVNILLNIFFGPAVNAARGVAYQVKGAVNMLVTNFQVAMNPQIVKSFASNDLKYMHQIIFQGSKFSFYLLYICSLPILIETEFILNLWLNNVPEYTIIFTRLALVNVLIDSLSGPLMNAAQASGNIKKYQAVVGGLLLLILPLSYVFLNAGYDPEITLYISISMSIIALLVRLYLISSLVSFPILSFMNQVVLKVILVSVSSIFLPLVLIHTMEYDLTRTIFVLLFSVISVLFSIYWFGITNKERSLIGKEIKNFLIKR